MNTILNKSSVAPDECKPRAWPVLLAGTVVAMASLSVFFVSRADIRDAAPFVWLDVAAIGLLFAIPFSWTIAVRVQSHVPRSLIILTSLILMCFPAMFRVIDAGSTESHNAIMGLRGTLTISAAIAGFSFVGALLPNSRRLGNESLSPVFLAGLLAVAFVVPELYVDSRCKRKENQLQDLLSQDRTGEGLNAARELAAIQPEREINFEGKLVKTLQLVGLLTEQFDNLVEKANLLERSQAPTDRLNLARILAQLGRREPAIRILRRLAEDYPGRTEVCILLGILYEYDRDWQNAHLWYLLAESQTTGHDFERATALKGIAFSARKLGHYSVAQTAYRKLIQDFPTADNDYLLAQFFEDAQQAGEARKYASRAMRKSPEQFKIKGESLIRRLKDRQFGCLNLLHNEAAK